MAVSHVRQSSVGSLDIRPVIHGLALVFAFCAFPMSSASGADEPNVSGTWTGSLQTIGNSGSCTLILSQNGTAVDGTLHCTDFERSFGPTPQPIANGQLAGERLTFTGARPDAYLLRADFTVKADEIRGWGVHAGRRGNYDVEFKFRRANR